MYGLSVEEKELYLTKAVSDDAVITLATFVVPFGSSKSEVFELAKEMVGVLNRDLENRGNDIAHSFDVATCDNPACPCHDAYIGPAIVHNTLPTDKEDAPMPDNWKPLSEQHAVEWPIDPETGTPKVEPVGEVKDFPEPGVAHPEGCLCAECDPPIKNAEVEA